MAFPKQKRLFSKQHYSIRSPRFLGRDEITKGTSATTSRNSLDLGSYGSGSGTVSRRIFRMTRFSTSIFLGVSPRRLRKVPKKTKLLCNFCYFPSVHQPQSDVIGKDFAISGKRGPLDKTSLFSRNGNRTWSITSSFSLASNGYRDFESPKLRH